MEVAEIDRELKFGLRVSFLFSGGDLKVIDIGMKKEEGIGHGVGHVLQFLVCLLLKSKFIYIFSVSIG